MKDFLFHRFIHSKAFEHEFMIQFENYIVSYFILACVENEQMKPNLEKDVGFKLLKLSIIVIFILISIIPHYR